MTGNCLSDKLFVEIVPLEGSRSPQPHPVDHGKFDVGRVYRVLGMYNPSETSECYFVLSNPERQIWFISNRHTRAYGLIETGELSLDKTEADRLLGRTSPVAKPRRSVHVNRLEESEKAPFRLDPPLAASA